MRHVIDRVVQMAGAAPLDPGGGGTLVPWALGCVRGLAAVAVAVAGMAAGTVVAVAAPVVGGAETIGAGLANRPSAAAYMAEWLNYPRRCRLRCS